MFKKQPFFKKPNEDEKFTIKKDDSNSKFKELSLDIVLDEYGSKMKSNTLLPNISLRIPTNNIKNKQLNFANKLFINNDQLKIKPINIMNKNTEIEFNPCNRKILFPSKINLKKKINNKDSDILSKFILPSNITNLFKYLKYSANRTKLDLEEIINSTIEKPEIKKLVPNKYCLGNDIVPSYLLKKTKKSKLTNAKTSKQENKFNSILKAYKAFGSYSNNELNVTFIGFPKSGKSTIIGNILIYLDVLESAFIKKTDWEATKMNSLEFKTAWLTDTSSDERLFKETILTSSHFVEIKEKLINIIDCPGNLCYYEQIIKSLTKCGYIILVVNLTNDWCIETLEYKHMDYLNSMLYLMKIFTIDKLEILFVNTLNVDIVKPYEKLKLIWKRFFKTEINYLSINKLIDITQSELTKIVEKLHNIDIESVEMQLDKPLLLEITDIYKPIESALPIVYGCVYRGGISSGINNSSSKGIIWPENVTCTVKSMKIQEKDEMKTRSFAFSGNHVELTLLEIQTEDKIKKGSFICHPDYPLTIKKDFLVEMRIFDCNIDVPIVNGIKVYLWTKSRCCFCELKTIISMEYLSNKQKITKKFPRLIQQSGSTLKAHIRSDDFLAIELNSMHKLDVFLLFSGLKLFAAGKFVDIIN